MSSCIHLWAHEKRDITGVQRVLQVESQNTLQHLNGRYLIFRIDCGITQELPVLDCYLPLMAMLAMAEGRSLHVHGRVTREAILNAYEFQEAWVAWKPKMFAHPIEIDADEIIDDWRPGPARALQAYSGGLDAMFTTWTHRVADNRARRRPLDRAVFAHGFDISLKDDTAFCIAAQKARRVLGTVDVELSTIRTNVRAAVRLGWEVIHGAALGAVLGQFIPDYSTALIGSSGSYTSLRIPWGSGPITDPLMSGAAMHFVHDGAGHSRLDKIRAIAGWKIATDNLRVCWHGANKWENCGKCEKCVRTALGFRAWGLPVPPSLKAEVTPADVATLLDSPRVSVDRLRELHAVAMRNNIRDPWVWQVRAQLTGGRKAVPRAQAPRDLGEMPVAGTA